MSTVTEDHANVLQCIARNILMCPCHEGAARDFNEMDEKDQEDVWRDLMAEGIDEEEEFETPELLAESMSRLNQEIAQLPVHSKTALDYAMMRFPDYVNNPLFRLKFLRAEKFDIHGAAVRMAIHFEQKELIFGPDLLGREITLQDFDEDDLHALHLGFFQILKDVDKAGRRVLFYYKALTNCYRKRENIIKVFWYMTNLISHDESVQKLGVVNLVYNIGGYPREGMDYEKSRRLANIMRGIPVRFDSFFVALDDAPWLTVVETFSMIVYKFLRVRMRSIIGTHMECCYKMMALGIPYKALPVTEQSELTTDFHEELFRQQRQREEQAAAAVATRTIASVTTTTTTMPSSSTTAMVINDW